MDIAGRFLYLSTYMYRNLVILFFLVCLPLLSSAQFKAFRDSIIQISGITMTADSLRAVPAVSILVKGQGRGTISNSVGVFSIVAFKETPCSSAP